MVKNKFIISENDRRHILSLYGLLLEDDKLKVRLFGKIPNFQNITEKIESIKIRQNSINIKPISQNLPDNDENWDTTVELEKGKFSIIVTLDDGSSGNFNFEFKGESELNCELKIHREKQEQEALVTKHIITLILKDSETQKNLSDIEVSIKFENGDIKTFTSNFEGKVNFIKNLEKTENINVSIKDENYRYKNETYIVNSNQKSIFILNLKPKKKFEQDVDDFKEEIFIPNYYKSNRFTFYGYTTNPMNNKEEALESAKKDAYNQFLKTIRKKFRENEIVKNAVPSGGEIVFHMPYNHNQYYYIIKYKKTELKKFVKSILKTKEKIDDDDEKKEVIEFENFSLDMALLKAKTQGKNIFILLGNDGTNFDEVVQTINDDSEFVSITNKTKVKIKIPVDDTSNDYLKLVDIFSQNRLSMRSFPRIIYLNKDKKILADYDFYTIVVDKKYKL